MILTAISRQSRIGQPSGVRPESRSMMPSNLKLRIGARADEDLSDIASFTEERWGSIQTETYISRLQQAYEELCQFPSAGHRHIDLPSGLRVWPVGRHLIIYLPMDDELQIVRIVHSRQDISRIELN
jgi:toxin ParE1/3/4